MRTETQSCVAPGPPASSGRSRPIRGVFLVRRVQCDSPDVVDVRPTPALRMPDGAVPLVGVRVRVQGYVTDYRPYWGVGHARASEGGGGGTTVAGAAAMGTRAGSAPRTAQPAATRPTTTTTATTRTTPARRQLTIPIRGSATRRRTGLRDPTSPCQKPLILGRPLPVHRSWGPLTGILFRWRVCGTAGLTPRWRARARGSAKVRR